MKISVTISTTPPRGLVLAASTKLYASPAELRDLAKRISDLADGGDKVVIGAGSIGEFEFCLEKDA